MSVFFSLAMVTDLGFESFVVRHSRGDQRHFLNVIWTIHAIRGVFLAVAATMMAPVVAWVLNKPDLLVPLAVSSWTLAINGFASFSLIVCLRLGQSRKLSVLDLALGVFQAGVCICLAIYLKNIWAFVLAMLAQSMLRTICSYSLFTPSSQRFATDRAVRQEFFGFSRVVMTSSLLTLILSQSDKLFLARLFTLREFGLYTIAINLSGVPIGFVSSYVGRIVFPQYSRAWLTEPNSIAHVYYDALRRTAPIYALGVGCLTGAAPLLVSVLYDKRYWESGFYLSILAVSAALRLPTFAAAEMMTAIGRIKVTLYLNVLRTAWLIIVGPISFLTYGTIGVIVVVGLLELPALLGSWFWLQKVGIFKLRYELLYVGLIVTGALVGSVVSRVGLEMIGR